MYFKTKFIPDVQARNINSYQFEVDCPYCGQTHVHDRGGLNGKYYGFRTSHCSERSISRAYRAKAPITCPVIERAQKAS